MTNLTGAVATRLEQLQSTYEGAPGFEAVVFDGRQSIVVVDADALPLWQQHLAGLDLAVAPSCVDKRLTVAVRDLLPALAPRDGIASVGYNGLEDAVEVHGIDSATLVGAIDERQPGIGRVALDAIANRTLRIFAEPLHDALGEGTLR